MTWLVVHTKSRAEEQAAQQLANQGYRIFLPRIRERKRRQSRLQWTISPLFPRYLFVDVSLGETTIAPIRSTVGVSTLVRFGHALATMPDSVIAYLRDHQDSELGARTVDESPHKPGDLVEILDGPFTGLTGVYQLSRADDRSLLLVELLGRQNAVEMPRCALRQAM